MKIVFSRKGFDSAAGGGPSPIVGGRALSLPIPEIPSRSNTRYCDLGLADRLDAARSSKVTPEALCHNDPMFDDGRCWFGQCDSAQTHLTKQGVGTGDVFLFFGLFRCPETGERHHRVFGYLRVADFGAPMAVRTSIHWGNPRLQHPHLNGEFPRNNCIWFGPGQCNAPAIPNLRLTEANANGRVSRWLVPSWLRECGLSYHGANWRWNDAPGQNGMVLLQSVGRGQEFVSDIGDRHDARDWLEARIAEIER